MESCQCHQGPDDSDTKACELCCKEPGDDKPCLSSFELNEPPLDIPDMFSKPGTPCNNYQGYCDVFQKCREVSEFIFFPSPTKPKRSLNCFGNGIHKLLPEINLSPVANARPIFTLGKLEIIVNFFLFSLDRSIPRAHSPPFERSYFPRKVSLL